MYDAAKDAILASGRLGDGVPCHLAAALLAGVTATAVASPVDVVKTRSGTQHQQYHVWTQCPKKFHPKVRNHGEGPY